MLGSLMFACGLALGFVFRILSPASGDTKDTGQPAAPDWNDIPWCEITRIDASPAFSTQLANLHNALGEFRSPGVPQVSLKRPTPV